MYTLWNKGGVLLLCSTHGNYSNHSTFILLIDCLFKAAPTAYGDSQARGRIGATAAGLHHRHSDAGSEPRL